MRTGGPRDGYKVLRGPHRITGLGPSFGSKFLYFTSPDDRRALILDQLTADWLGREASLSLNPTRWSIRTYDAYTSTMNRWSPELEIPAHQLEEILFTGEATRRGLAAGRHDDVAMSPASRVLRVTPRRRVRARRCRVIQLKAALPSHEPAGER